MMKSWKIDWSYVDVVLGTMMIISAVGITFIILTYASKPNDSNVWERSDVLTLEEYWGFENCTPANVIATAYICEVPLTGQQCLVMPDPVVEKNIQALDCEW